jgi:hypothetical protein
MTIVAFPRCRPHRVRTYRSPAALGVLFAPDTADAEDALSRPQLPSLPERRLIAATVADAWATLDLTPAHRARRDLVLYATLGWFLYEDSLRSFSFPWCATALSLDVEAVRARVKRRWCERYGWLAGARECWAAMRAERQGLQWDVRTMARQAEQSR